MAKIYKITKNDPSERAPLFPSCRLILAIIGFFMFVHLYAQRVGMSVAIVCMVNHTAIKQPGSGGDSDGNETVIVPPTCDRQTSNSTQDDGPFVWEKDVQGHILGAFFYGYLVSQIPGGLLAERYGGKWILVIFLGISTLATLLTPLAAQLSFVLLIVLRVFVGIGSGALFPAMHAMLGQWAPPLERSLLCGLTYAGTMMGNVIALPLSGFLCQNGFAGGWGSVFYIIGLSSAACIIVWALLTSNTPATHPRISDAEKNYILNALKGEVSEEKTKWSEVPWCEFVKSGPVWALIIANFCTDWGLYTYLTNIPTFYKDVLYFDIQSNGLYSALPFVGLWANMTISPIIADKLRSAGILSTVVTRKLFNSIGLLGAGFFLIGLGFLDCSQTVLAVALLTLAVTISGCVYSGYFVNHMDIAPQYAGTLMGISNGLSASAGFIAPAIAAAITKSQERSLADSWRIVFFIAACVYAFGAIMYCVLGSGVIQPWAKKKEEMEEMDDVKVVENGSPNGRPIYKPRLSNGSLPTDPMLTEEKI